MPNVALGASNAPNATLAASNAPNATLGLKGRGQGRQAGSRPEAPSARSRGEESGGIGTSGP